MGKIITITNQKGGVGKTTTAVNLTAYLAYLGKKILLIDLDPQGNTSSGLGQNTGDNSIYEVIINHLPIERSIVPTMVNNLFLIPADIRLAGAEVELVQVEKREFQLKEALAPIKNQYDFIFIDCPPSLSLLTINGLTCADSVLIPIQSEYYALEGVTSLINTINRVKKLLIPPLMWKGF